MPYGDVGCCFLEGLRFTYVKDVLVMLYRRLDKDIWLEVIALASLFIGVLILGALLGNIFIKDDPVLCPVPGYSIINVKENQL